MLTRSDDGLSLLAKLSLLWRVWAVAARVRLELWRHPLPEVVSVLAAPTGRPRVPTSLLSRAVSRGLRIGPLQPRCLTRSLVLYRLLRAQGDDAQLIIGMRDKTVSTDAHAWVELAGRDVGPLPGGKGYRELSRYPRSL
ncbi:MAG TPA: lasso peptide biosynthesis B2 protein [Candidatus Limnocylindria bacterium]|nr:lasso peptide biosynthesis B2 protein [Candidatus Limnocylindria bacterium]